MVGESQESSGASALVDDVHLYTFLVKTRGIPPKVGGTAGIPPKVGGIPAVKRP